MSPYHLPANAVLGAVAEFATIVGPPLAGVLIGWGGPIVVIAVDAATFGVLAATYRLAVPAVPAVPTRHAGFSVILRDRRLVGLLVLTFGFFLLFGPVYVALPVHVADDLHASAAVLGFYYTAFGIGALAGALASGYLRRWSLWPTTIGVVLGFGVAMLPLGLGAPTAVTLVCFALAGLIWAPFTPTSMALFQRSTTAANRTEVLTANAAVAAVSVPVGTVLGGPLVVAVGARETLLFSACGTLALGVAAAGIAVVARRRGPSRDPSSRPSVTEL